MKNFRFVSLLFIGVFTATLALAAVEMKTATAQQQSPKRILQRYGFVDENGDGINDLARDADNDGIPNCLDPDWVRPEDGTGYKNRNGIQRRRGNRQGGDTPGSGCNRRWDNGSTSDMDTIGCGRTTRNSNQNRARRATRNG